MEPDPSRGHRTIDDTSDTRRDLDEIIGAGERGTRLVRQLLVFSRKQIARPQTVDMNELVDAMRTILTPTLSETIEVTTELAPRLWQAQIDPAT